MFFRTVWTFKFKLKRKKSSKLKNYFPVYEIFGKNISFAAWGVRGIFSICQKIWPHTRWWENYRIFIYAAKNKSLSISRCGGAPNSPISRDEGGRGLLWLMHKISLYPGWGRSFKLQQKRLSSLIKAIAFYVEPIINMS